MLEKDIENLIAHHPADFFPKEKFQLIGQQYSLKKRKLDILFEDNFGRYIIVEVKRGILSRKASGQIIEYYGLLKEENPGKNIELVLCANVIPHERRKFLENVGIECKELSVGFICNIAEKYNYNFLDAEKEKTEIKQLQQIKAEAESKSKDDINVWIFQANPKEYDILNALSDKTVGNKIHWYVGQHKKRIKNGHIGLLWMSGKDAGIYAVTLITSDPKFTHDYIAARKYWSNIERGSKKLLRVEMMVIKRLLNKPIFRSDLKKLKDLKTLSILKCAQGTNFPVKNSEWKIITDLIDKKYGGK
ncbi:endonuclease NucS domain-containing protein [Candidatus Riflebacteria bacterium]